MLLINFLYSFIFIILKMSSFPKIKLTEVLQYLEKPEPLDKPFLFVNPSEDLYTFFKYKGNKIDILKDKIKLD